jgi:hypothetical protein
MDMNNIIKTCQNKKVCQNVVGYNKLVTSSNNPNQSRRMRYSQLANNNKLTNITYEEYKILYGPTPQPPIPPAPNNRLFMTLFY